MVKHNNILPNVHCHKDWQRYVKTWFDQPGRKKTRRVKRLQKASAVAPRPVSGPLRPVVRCQTNQYNIRVRAGRGFTLEELKEAGVSRKQALSIGVAVDHRRKNRSVEAMQANVQRLQEYKTRLILFPRDSRKPKKGDSDAVAVSSATQLKGELMPIRQPFKREKARAITDNERDTSAYYTLRMARSNVRLVGIREKRAKAKAEAESQATKKK